MPALIAYYCGVFALCFLPAPVAIFLGIKGLKLVKADPSLPGKGHAITGIILGSIFTVLWIAMFIFIWLTYYGSNNRSL